MASVNNYCTYRYLKQLNQEMVIPALERIGSEDGFKIRLCGEYVNSLVCKACGARHYTGFNRCKNRWCLNCMRVRMLLWLAKIKQKYDQVVSEDVYPVMIVLTIRDGVDVDERIRFIEDSWRKFTNGDKKWRKVFKKRFYGGVRSLEVKRGRKSGLWHPHFHIFALMYNGRYGKIKDFYWIRKRWKEVTGGNGSVYIEAVKKRGSLIKSILECVKYIVKPERRLFLDEDFEKVYWALKRKRMINTWGCFRGMSSEVEKDLDIVEEKKLEQFVCSVCGCTEAELKSYLDDGTTLYYDLEERGIQ